MTKIRLILNALAVVTVCLICSSLAQAQASRTWVSGVGDDVNPCSRTAPCKTFAGAISKTAAGGEINAIDAGGFGAVTITKSITIDGGNAAMAGILAAGVNGVIVNTAGATDVVTLRNLSINGFITGLNGVRILKAGSVSVDRCAIFKFRAAGNGFGIVDLRSSTSTNPELYVNDTIIRDNLGSGIATLAGDTTKIAASINNVRATDNSNAGIAADAGTRMTVSNSVASGNTNFGFFVGGTATNTGELNLESCVASSNGTGLSISANGTMRLSNVHSTGNSTGIANAGNIGTHGNNKIGGNVAGNGAPLPGTVTNIGPQ